MTIIKKINNEKRDKKKTRREPIKVGTPNI